MAWIHAVPRTFDWTKAQIPQFANISPDMTLPPNAVFLAATSGAGWTQPLLMRKGNTHYDWSAPAIESGGNSNAYAAAYPNKKYHSVVRINDQFGMNSNTTQAQAEGFADQLPMDCSLFVFETQEGEPYLPPNAIQWFWFHSRLRARCNAQTAIDGVMRWVCHNYFHFATGPFVLGNWALNRQLYAVPFNQWNTITYTNDYGHQLNATDEFSPGAALSPTNMIVEGVYMGNPDDDANRFMGALFSMDVTRMRGKKSGLLVFGVREYRPNWLEGTNYSDGRLMRSMKQKLPPRLLMDCGFMAQEFGGPQGGCGVEYGVIGYQPASKKPVEYYAPVHNGTDHWKRTGDSNYTQFPYYGQAGPGHYNFGGGDFFYFGTKQWNDTVGQVWQGTPTFARFSINGTWYEKAANESDLIDARQQQRGLCRLRIHNGKMSVWYMNKFADHTKQTLVFQHPTDPSRTWSRQVSGTGVHSELITL